MESLRHRPGVEHKRRWWQTWRSRDGWGHFKPPPKKYLTSPAVTSDLAPAALRDWSGPGPSFRFNPVSELGPPPHHQVFRVLLFKKQNKIKIISGGCLQTVWTDRKHHYLEETGKKKKTLKNPPWHLSLMEADASDKNKCPLGGEAKVWLADIKTIPRKDGTMRGRERSGCRDKRTLLIIPQFPDGVYSLEQECILVAMAVILRRHQASVNGLAWAWAWARVHPKTRQKTHFLTS